MGGGTWAVIPCARGLWASAPLDPGPGPGGALSTPAPVVVGGRTTASRAPRRASCHGRPLEPPAHPPPVPRAVPSAANPPPPPTRRLRLLQVPRRQSNDAQVRSGARRLSACGRPPDRRCGWRAGLRSDELDGRRTSGPHDRGTPDTRSDAHASTGTPQRTRAQRARALPQRQVRGTVKHCPTTSTA